MIAIHRPLPAPAILTEQGNKRSDTHCRSYTENEAAYRSGEKTFPFDSRIYAHETVKAALVAMQRGKCAYCERIIGLGGDVEHFRPKGNVCQAAGGAAQTPGYYWLAYEWSNLLYACKDCNQTHKGVLFPLRDPAKRARSHTDAANLSQEEPLLLDPTQTDPSQVIGFREEFAYAVEGNPSGTATITVCGLNRPDVRDERRQHLNTIRLLQDLLSLAQRGQLEPLDEILAAKASKIIRESLEETAKFAAMARAALRPAGG